MPDSPCAEADTGILPDRRPAKPEPSRADVSAGDPRSTCHGGLTMPAVRPEHPNPRKRSYLAPIGALLLAGALSGTAQGATLIGETTWGGPAAESVGDAAVAADGSTYLAGFTTSFGATSPTLFV